jgi:hypothetical protein
MTDAIDRSCVYTKEQAWGLHIPERVRVGYPFEWHRSLSYFCQCQRSHISTGQTYYRHWHKRTEEPSLLFGGP